MKKFALLFALLSSFAFATDVAKITPQAAAQLVQDGKAVLVDVREPSECADSGVAAPAVILPKSDFDGDQKLWKEFLGKNGKKQLILYCRSGHRAGIVADVLAAEGHQVANAGGFNDWVSAGLPVRKIEPTKK